MTRRAAVPLQAALFAALFFAVWRVQAAQRAAAAVAREATETENPRPGPTP